MPGASRDRADGGGRAPAPPGTDQSVFFFAAGRSQLLNEAIDGTAAGLFGGLEQGDFKIVLFGEPALHRSLAAVEGIEHAHDGLGSEFAAEGIGAPAVFDGSEESRPQMGLEILQDTEKVTPFRGKGIDRLHDGGVVERSHGTGKGFNTGTGCQPVDIEDVFFINPGTAEGNHLIEDRLGVAHTAISQTGDGPEGFGGDFDALGLSDLGKLIDDDGIGNRAKLKALAAGNDGRQHFVGLGRGKDKLHVGGRLFEGLEQGIEGRSTEHVYFVDNIDFKAALGRGKAAVFAEVADLIDAVVRGAVNFDDVHAGAVHDGAGDIGIVIRGDAGATFGIEGLGKETGGTGLSGTAGADKEIGVGDPVALDGVAQGADDMILPDQFVELLGSPSAGNYLVTIIHQYKPSNPLRGMTGKGLFEKKHEALPYPRRSPALPVPRVTFAASFSSREALTKTEVAKKRMMALAIASPCTRPWMRLLKS